MNIQRICKTWTNTVNNKIIQGVTLHFLKNFMIRTKRNVIFKMDTFTNQYRTSNEKKFYVEHKLLGVTTSPQSANQIQEATSRLNAGVKHIELELISPELFDSVPKQH